MRHKTVVIGNGNPKEVNNLPQDIFWSSAFDKEIIRDITGIIKSEWQYLEIIDTETNLKYTINVEKI